MQSLGECVRNVPFKFLVITCAILTCAACHGKKAPAPAAPTKAERITTPPMQITETTDLAKGMQSTTNVPIAPIPPPSTSTQPPLVGTTPGLPANPYSPKATQTYTPTPIKAKTNIELVIDGTGSMNSAMSGMPKIELVKKTLRDLATQPFPTDTQRFLGLRVFGASSSVDEKNCQDSQLLTPVKPLDAVTWAAGVDKLSAKGSSALAYAMEQAAADFPNGSDDTDNLLIVVTDGEDTCGKDPCNAALQLHQSPKKVIVHLIGFDLDSHAQTSLTCIPKSADGQFYLARNEYELRNDLEQSLYANYPYNLRLKVLAGATPIPATLTVYQGGTEKIVQRDKVSGIKFYKLPAGTYDIAVEYSDSPETTKPSKLLKGVDLQATTRAEQIVQLPLGNLTLGAFDQSGAPTKAVFQIRKTGGDIVVPSFQAGPEPQTIALTPGMYDVTAEMTEANGLHLNAVATNKDIKEGATTEELFKFQTGQFFVRMQHPEKGFIPGAYRVTKVDQPDQVLATGDVSPDGTAMELPPGNYDMYLDVKDPDLSGLAGVKLANIQVSGGDMRQQLITLTSGGLKLFGKDTQGKGVHTDFSIRKAGETAELTKATSEDKEKIIFIPPGHYDIVATNTGANVTPAPTIVWNNIEVKEGETTSQEANFQLGEIKLMGRNVKEQRISTQFTVYRSGSDEPLGAAMADTGWASFYLTPGFYDFEGKDVNATTEPKPTVWFHDVEILVGNPLSKEAIFSSGKLKVICRGENNVVLPCTFSVFTYRSDRPLYSGLTTDNWKDYDIPPGKYYMEAGYNDPEAGVLLKKWINFSVEENQIVEQVLRF